MLICIKIARALSELHTLSEVEQKKFIEFCELLRNHHRICPQDVNLIEKYKQTITQ